MNPQRLICKATLKDSFEKAQRRARVAGAYRFLLLSEDDLNDFVSVPPVDGECKDRTAQRERYVEANRDDWGVRWFILPNPVYGSCEKAIGYRFQEKLDAL